MGDDEALIRYCMGDLDEAERAAVEARLRSDPQFAQQHAELCECLSSASGDLSAEGDSTQHAPPELLASRTAAAVMAAQADRQGGRWLPPVEEPLAFSQRRFSLIEVLTVGVAALILGMLILPAVQTGRETSRRIMCANNLRQVGESLQHYSQANFSRYPPIGPGVPAGMFSVMLVEDDVATTQQLERWLTCPSSWHAQQAREGVVRVRVPQPAEVYFAASEQLPALLRDAAGSYAYRLGHVVGRVYWYPRNRGDCRAPVIADAPEHNLGTIVVSRNHGDCGENVLFQDGHVAFISSCYSQSGVDHLFLNDAGQLAAGRRPADVVLAPGDVTPGVTGLVGVQF